MYKTKRGIFIVVLSVFLISLISSPAYAGFFDWFEDFRARVTGEATRITEVNITLGAGGGAVPQIILIFNNTGLGGALTEGPEETNFTVNFSVSDADGAGNLNVDTATVNFSRAGEDVRYNVTCSQYQSSGNFANFTCSVIQMFWFDIDGAWTISANISDNNGNTGVNNSVTFTVSATTGFVLSPGNLTFATITAGSTNNTATNDPMLLNNTGNQDIASPDISINATDLVGETTSTEALYSGNFSVANSTGGTDECNFAGNATVLNATSGGSFIGINGIYMNASNFTINNGIEGQEELYFCNLEAGSELSQQSYSTLSQGAWTVRIVIILPFIRDYLLELSYVTIFPISLALIKNINNIDNKIKVRKMDIT